MRQSVGCSMFHVKRWTVVISLATCCVLLVGIYLISSSRSHVSTWHRSSLPGGTEARLEFYAQQFALKKLRGYDASSNKNSEFRVPNIIHFIHFGGRQLSFVTAMCIKAAYLRQRPDKLYIHTDLPQPEQLLGPWWLKLSNYKNLHISHYDRPQEIFGRKIGVIQHASDVARLEILMKHGGIYMDSDLLLLSSLDDLRVHDFSVPWPEEPGSSIGNQLLMSTTEAPFLYLYYNTYHKFDDKQWYYNAGDLPTQSLLKTLPQLVHRISDSDVAVSTVNALALYRADYKQVNWRAVHLLYGHRSYLFKEDYKRFPSYDESNIYKKNSTVTRLLRKVYEAKVDE